MGQVLIPSQHQLSCEVEAMPQERQALEQLLAPGGAAAAAAGEGGG